MGAVIVHCLPFPKAIPRVGRKSYMKQSLKQLVLKLQRSGTEWPKGMSGLNSHLHSRTYFWLTHVGNWSSADVCFSKRSSASQPGQTYLREASATHCARWQCRSRAVYWCGLFCLQWSSHLAHHTLSGLQHNLVSEGHSVSRERNKDLTPQQRNANTSSKEEHVPWDMLAWHLWKIPSASFQTIERSSFLLFKKYLNLHPYGTFLFPSYDRKD